MPGLALLLVGGTVGCGGSNQATPPDVFLPTGLRSGSGGLAALAEGTLILDNGCVWLEQDGGNRYLPIWPKETAVLEVNGALVISVRDERYSIGTRLLLGGGESPSRALIEEAIGQRIPDQCFNGMMWSVSSVDPG
jgi:hypothetical protein